MIDLVRHVEPGTTREETFSVEEHHLAAHVGSGSARVLSTPSMIGFMERTAHNLLADRLPEGYSSVGTVVSVRHLAPTPAGGSVRVLAEVLAVEGSKVVLRVQAWDAAEQVGDGTHERAVIDVERFLKRVEAKGGA